MKKLSKKLKIASLGLFSLGAITTSAIAINNQLVVNSKQVEEQDYESVLVLSNKVDNKIYIYAGAAAGGGLLLIAIIITLVLVFKKKAKAKLQANAIENNDQVLEQEHVQNYEDNFQEAVVEEEMISEQIIPEVQQPAQKRIMKVGPQGVQAISSNQDQVKPLSGNTQRLAGGAKRITK